MPRGEFTLVIAGCLEENPPPPPAAGELRELYRGLLGQGVERRDALRLLMRETGLSRRTVYDAVRKDDDPGEPDEG